jgi:hypothetical protein
MKIVKYVTGFCIGASVLAACGDTDSGSADLKTPYASAEKKVNAPFHYQKAIEVKPGLTFDIMSWGRGADSVKSYIIFRSDSVKQKYTSASGELTGNVTDSWNMDMDSDGNPELFIQAKSKSPDLKLYVNEFDGSGAAQKLRFPDLSDATRKKYRGHDSLYIKEDKLMREFPLYKEGDTDAKPTDGRKYVAYGLSNNEFTVQNMTANGEPEKVQVVQQPKKVVKKKPKRRRR